jgi:putative DNA primase/helicase
MTENVTPIGAAKGPRKAKPRPSTGDWRDALVYTQTPTDGYTLAKHTANAIFILRHDPDWTGVLAYDEFASAVVMLRPPPWHDHDAPASRIIGTWTDEDATRSAAGLARKWSLRLGSQTMSEAARVVAQANAFHPVRQYLDGLVWDGTLRLDNMLVNYFGATSDAYVKKIGRWWTISAVARIYEPGCKADYVLIAEGPQGYKKSTAARKLAGDKWITDELGELGSKDAYQQLRGKWIVELAELDSFSRAEANRAKAFFSASTDRYRPSYGREPRDFPRQCVFFGSTNNSQYLRDDTGNRRYWPFRAEKIDVDAIERDRNQIWAEAKEAYFGKNKWWPSTTDEHKACTEEQAERYQADEWETAIHEWAGNTKETVTVAKVLEHALGMKREKWTRADQTRAGVCLTRLGWTRKQKRDGVVRTWFYEPPKEAEVGQ